MARRPGPAGTCHLCLKHVERLSYEHVPPEKAFNDCPSMRADMDLYIRDRDQMFKRGEVQQRGSGAYTLCESCNSDTGSWYGADYVEWAKRGFELLSRFPGAGEHAVTMPRVRPLRFLKQAVTMLFSVNDSTFARRHEELQWFVLNKESRGLSNRYEFYLTLVRGGYGRCSGISSMGSLESGQVRVTSEIVHVPFAILVTFNSPAIDDLGRITRFANYGLDDRVDVTVNLTAGEAHTPFPADYRTREEVDRAREAGQAAREVPPEDRAPPRAADGATLEGQLREAYARLRGV